MEPEFTFRAKVWEWSGDHPSWFMITVPQDAADEISELVPQTGGFGSIRVEATIGKTAWKTSIFPSKEQESYVLPVKKPVRKAENLDDGSRPKVMLRILI